MNLRHDGIPSPYVPYYVSVTVNTNASRNQKDLWIGYIQRNISLNKKSNSTDALTHGT